MVAMTGKQEIAVFRARSLESFGRGKTMSEQTCCIYLVKSEIQTWRRSELIRRGVPIYIPVDARAGTALAQLRFRRSDPDCLLLLDDGSPERRPRPRCLLVQA